MIEATILAGKSGLKVDFITSDGGYMEPAHVEPNGRWGILGQASSAVQPIRWIRSARLLSNFRFPSPHQVPAYGLVSSCYEVLEGQGSPAQEHQLADKCLDAGNIDAAAELLLKTSEHASCAAASSDSRLIFYIAGYVERRRILKMKCQNCLRVLLMSKEKSLVLNLAEFVRLKDKRVLLYPSAVLYRFVLNIENAFTECFSLIKLYCDSILDILCVVKAKQQCELGCSNHC
ncbi:hypothetical protein HPB48_026115 [Haemaphysalis longicornis]|uniref:Uncharacterized protein n=1 Tax=Haemaphysalis longicornis TaxID=44386 RepID=A0A9J6HB02_HAELO|nr:hypothetical protein HPB48_026115 [Haemaphysalis longicornis]